MYFLVASLDRDTRRSCEDNLMDKYLHAYAHPTHNVDSTSSSSSSSVDAGVPEETSSGSGSGEVTEGENPHHHTEDCDCCAHNTGHNTGQNTRQNTGHNTGQNTSPGSRAAMTHLNSVSKEEFKMYCRMAVQGLVFRCITHTQAMANMDAPMETRVACLGTLVTRTVDAIVDYDLHSLLAVGRS